MTNYPVEAVVINRRLSISVPSRKGPQRHHGMGKWILDVP
jgi:hypothetical protein